MFSQISLEIVFTFKKANTFIKVLKLISFENFYKFTSYTSRGQHKPPLV